MANERTSDRSVGGSASGASVVDVERLADRVYRLMLADVRLERARSGDADPVRTGD